MERLGYHDDTYLDALAHVQRCGKRKANRTGVDTLAVFGYQMRFDLIEGFPLLTTKKMFWKGIVHELLWMIRGGDSAGNMNVSDLQINGVYIWDEWADPDGNLGPVYGSQWRSWVQNYRHKAGSIDQLQTAIDMIRNEPESRRIIVTAWNPSDLPEMRLPPCHLLYQFIVDDNEIHCHLFMRSADIFLGVPFNIASYALLTHLVGRVTGLIPGQLVISYTDLHLYVNHIEQAQRQLDRREKAYPSPIVRISPVVKDIDDFRSEHIDLLDYAYHPAIKAEVAV